MSETASYPSPACQSVDWEACRAVAPSPLQTLTIRQGACSTLAACTKSACAVPIAAQAAVQLYFEFFCSERYTMVRGVIDWED